MHPRSDNRVFYVVLRKRSVPVKEKKGNSLLDTVPRNARKSSKRKEKKRKSNFLLLSGNIETKRVNRDIRRFILIE